MELMISMPRHELAGAYSVTLFSHSVHLSCYSVIVHFPVIILTTDD